jgi:hypothetical protein
MRRPFLIFALLLAGCGGPAAPSAAPIESAADARAALQAAPHPDAQVELQRMTQAKAALDKERSDKLAEVANIESAIQGTEVAHELSGAREPDAARSAAQEQARSKTETLRQHITDRLDPDVAEAERRLAAAAAQLKIQTEQRVP